MTNRKFSIIAGIIGIVLLVVLLNVLYIYQRNEKSKIYFNIDDIKDINWINNDVSFKIYDYKLTFIKGEEEIVYNKNISYDNRTGKIESDGKTIYLRSVGDDSIIIWYEQEEFNLEKEFIAK